MKKQLLKIILFVGGLVPMIASAHAGHNHGAPESGAVHAGFVVAGVVAIGFAICLTRKMGREQQRRALNRNMSI